MRKSRLLVLIGILCVFALLAAGLFACKPVEDPSGDQGRVTPVATAMNTVYAAMTAADGSKGVNYFTLTFDGSYAAEGKIYDFDFGGAFDITQNNRDDDKRTELYFEVKQGSTEVFLLYYLSGELYLDFAPYARRARIADYNLAEAVHEIFTEKESGVIKTVADSLPLVASRIFNGCRYFSEEGVDRYVFTLSYAQLFDAFSSLVESWEAGFTPAELLAALHLTESSMTALTEETAATTVEFRLQEGAFLSAKAETAGKTSFSLDSFSLTSGTAALTLPSALSTFTEFDFRNFALSGTLQLSTVTASSERALNYGVTLGREYDETVYPFTYDFKSHYVAGSGWEFALSLTDKNGKASFFRIKGEYLYADLSAFGIQRFKIKTADLSEELGTVGFKDVDAFDFKDELRLLMLLAAGRSEEGDTVTYRLGADFFDLLSEKVGFKGLFGISSAELGWSKANDRLQNLTASLRIGGMTASLSAASFTFGTPVSLPEPEDALYYDLSARDTTRISSSGTFAAHTSFSSDGAYLSALLSSLSGEALSFSAEGSIGYNVDFVYGASGALKRFFLRLYTARGAEIVNLFYTEDTPGVFYLIYPEIAGSREVRTCTLASEPLAAFNEALGAVDSSVGQRILLIARENTFTIGLQSPMVSFVGEKLKLLYPELSLDGLSALKCRRYELRLSAGMPVGRVVFDSDNDLTISASTFAVTFGEDWDISSLTAAAPQKVAILADNDMPEFATATFTDGLTYLLSLRDVRTGEKTWTYAGVPDHVGTAGQETEVTATATLLGKTVTARVKVDISPATAVELSGSASYASKFDANEKTFHFTLYNDVAPGKALATFPFLVATVGEREYVKDISWDLTGLTTSLDRKDFTVRPKVKTYFGNEITLGNVANYTVHIEGDKAVSTDYSMTFVAYDGRDPLNSAVYSDVLNVETRSGEKITVEHVEWDLTNANVESKAKAGILYAYNSDPEHPDKVIARVYDLTGNFVRIEVPIYFVAKEVETVSFDLSHLEGVTYDAAKSTFVFDVLKVRSLSPTSSDSVLPGTLTANAGEESEFTVKGIKWEFEAVEGVMNASGQTGTLALVIGDEISGYQRISFRYQFTKAEIVKTALLDADKRVILQKGEGLYSYTFDHLNAYTYSYPVYIRATYRAGEGEQEEDLRANWSFDRAFREEELCQGGAYVLTGAVGSESMTVMMIFDQKRITSYRFTAEELTVAGGEISLTEKQGRSALTYSVLAAIGGASGLDYTKTTSYPAKISVAFNGESEFIETDAVWDLSAYQTKTDMIGSGFLGTVKASVKGQIVEVYVYVAPAVGDYDTVYVNREMTANKITFRLMTPKDGGFVVTDPRDKANYPAMIYIKSGENEYAIEVRDWLGVEEVTKLYNVGLSSGKAASEIKGEVTVRARIGGDLVGYKEISIPVAVVDSAIGEIAVSGLPFAASSELTGGATPYAITPSYESGTHGTFSYRFSLGINPYYVNPKAQESYPAYLDFTLDGVAVRTRAVWDLTRIPENAAKTGNTTRYAGDDGIYGFPIYAMIDLGATFPNVLVPVEVDVLKREIDKVWIAESSQPYLDVDGYAAAPFGNDVEGDEVTIDVKVQFKGDANRYPLKLKYSKAGVVLSYDGSGLYENITVQVGNENGGYQALEGYTIRVISNIVSEIRLSDEDKLEGSSGVFFTAEYESEGSDKLIYTYNHVMDMGKELPESLMITFGIGGTPRTVYRADSEEGASDGVVFLWVRNDKGHIGVELWNPSVAQSIGGAKQAIYNSEQSDYNTPRATMFFEEEEVWTEIYRDSVDEAGYITVKTAIAHYKPNISTAKIEADYQHYYITVDEEGAEKLGEETRLGVGAYRLYVDVIGHSHYKGEVYKIFTITPKDITESVVLIVDGARRDDGSSDAYRGASEPYVITAGSGDYDISVPMLVNGSASASIVDVKYREPNSSVVVAYTFEVTVAPEEKNYKVTDKTLSFKITEVPYENVQEDIYVHLTWVAARSEFEATVKVFEEDLFYDPDLTNGYAIKYYEREDSLEEITEFEAGKAYYYVVTIKLPNHTRYMTNATRITAK